MYHMLHVWDTIIYMFTQQKSNASNYKMHEAYGYINYIHR